jgi:hypothetical protein
VLTSVSEKLGFSFSSGDMSTYYGHELEAFLTKPFEPGVLLKTAQRVLQSRK